MGGDHFHSSGSGEQNIAQGDHAIGKQENNFFCRLLSRIFTTGNQSPAIVAGGNVSVSYNSSSAPPPIIPNQRPALEPCFLHRDDELVWLNERLHPGAVVAVCGPGGMGKSALAAKAVHQLEPARFPDGIVFHSFYHQPSTEQALQAVCAAFQVEAKAGLESAVRQALSGRRALLMLDGTEQADDLPAILKLRGQCGVLITSRKTEDALDELLELKRLKAQQAEEVFLRYSGPVDDMASVAGICKILDGWPVALRIAGRYLSSTKESAATYLRFLAKMPFKRLGSGEHQQENAALLLRRSVEKVSGDAQQVLRLTGVLAFASIALAPIMAVLAKEGEDQDELELRSTDALNELVTYGLLERSGERWQISHALIHTYARTELALSTDALKRLALWYIAFCEAAKKEGAKSYTLLDAERAHCLRLMESCLNRGLIGELSHLVGEMDIYLDLQGHWIDYQVAFKIMLTGSRQAGHRHNQGWCLNQLGLICRKSGEYKKALAYFEQCLPIHRKLGEEKEQGDILNNIGWTYDAQGNYEQSLQYYKQSLKIRRRFKDRMGEGITLNNIAMVYTAQGKHETALKYLKQDIAICRNANDKVGEATTLNNFGIIYYIQNNFSKALQHWEQALAIAQQFGDRAGEAKTCSNIADIYARQGDLAKAEEHIAQAVQLAEQMSHPDLEEWRDGLAWVRAARRGKGNS